MKSGIQPNYQAAGDNTRRRSFPLSFPNLPLLSSPPVPCFSRAPFFPPPPLPFCLRSPLSPLPFPSSSSLFSPSPFPLHALSFSLSLFSLRGLVFLTARKGGAPDRGWRERGASFFAPSPLPRQRPSHVILCIFFLHGEEGRGDGENGIPRSWKCFSRTRRRRRRRRRVSSKRRREGGRESEILLIRRSLAPIKSYPAVYFRSFSSFSFSLGWFFFFYSFVSWLVISSIIVVSAESRLGILLFLFIIVLDAQLLEYFFYTYKESLLKVV